MSGWLSLLTGDNRKKKREKFEKMKEEEKRAELA